MALDALKAAIQDMDGNLELVRELGRGATAIVYLLRDRQLERDVALKVIRGGVGVDAEAIARLEREAHLVAQLQHPNIVKLYGTHRLPDEGVALLMEHVPGRNLKEILRKEGALPVPVVMRILQDVASALAYAHRRRIVHRDVKPENIYIDEEVGAARLADFGVARPWDQDSRLTLPGASLGTPAYMSPEQIDGKEVDGRSDVYSLGLVGYEMILGRHPWEDENVFTTIFKQKNEVLSLDLPGLERYPMLARILKGALEKDLESRPESADVFLARLKEVVPGGRPVDPGPLRELEGAEGAGGRRESRSPDRGEIPWDDIDWTSPPDRSPAIDWPDFGDTSGQGRVPEDRDRSSEEDVDEDTADSRTPLKKGRGKARIWIWAAAAVILLVGGYGIFRWYLSEGEPGDRAESASMVRGPEPTSPPPSEPAVGGVVDLTKVSLLAVGETEAEGEVGSSMRLAARVTGPQSSPVERAAVIFRIREGEGTLTEDRTETGTDGLAEAEVQLPREPDTISVEASLAGVSGPEIRYLVRVVPGQPQEARIIVGDTQTAPSGETLPAFLGLRVRDEFGNFVPGVPVRFDVRSGGGSASPDRTVTDDVGRAFTRWTLGPSAGLQTLAAIVPGPRDSVLTFQATATAEEAPESDPAPRTAQPTPLPPPGPARVRPNPLAIGGSHVCRLRNERASCRGASDRGQIGQDRIPARLMALAAGVSHTCALDEGGEAWCWGANESGQLGDGSTEDRSTPEPVATEIPFSLLAAGLSHTCGLDSRGIAHCWGRNLNGQLGDGTRSDRRRPAPVSGDLRFESLTAGWNHTCGLTPSGQTYCWGLNEEAQLGDGTRVDRLSPTPVTGDFRYLTAGARHTCGIDDQDQVLCWGDNRFGQLGSGMRPETQVLPSPTSDLPAPANTLAAGAVHTCALLRDGSTLCWGQNLHGQLGNGTTETSPVPMPLAGELRFSRLFAGGGVTCAFTPAGDEYCWGLNQGGQLGDGTRTNRPVPVPVGRE